MIYLDHAATTPLLPEAKSAMQKILGQPLGNASALHTPGQQAKQIIDDARKQVAELLNATPEEILFTSGGSESNNTVINTFRDQNIAISPIEHPSITLPAKKLAKSCQTLPLEPLKTSSSADQIADQNPQSTARKNLPPTTLNLSDLKPNTALISIMLANNETGQIFDIKSLAEQAHRQGAKFHTDATQAIGKIPIDVKALGVDYLTFSAHKIGGPLGIGVLYHKKGTPLDPLILGGHQENNLRAGTENLPAIAGLAVAAKIAKTTPEKYAKKVAPLRDELAKKLLKTPGATLNTPWQEGEAIGNVLSRSAFSYEKRGATSPVTTGARSVPRKNISIASPVLPNILNVSFKAAEGESIQLYLDAKGIIVSTGSACAAGDIKPSPVLMALTGDPERAHSSIRLSLGLETTSQDIEKTAEILKETVEKLQKMSTIKLRED